MFVVIYFRSVTVHSDNHCKDCYKGHNVNDTVYSWLMCPTEVINVDMCVKGKVFNNSRFLFINTNCLYSPAGGAMNAVVTCFYTLNSCVFIYSYICTPTFKHY